MENNQPEIIDVKGKYDKKVMLFMLFVCIASILTITFQFFGFNVIRLLHALLGVAAFALFYYKKPFILFTWIWLIVQLPDIRYTTTDAETGVRFIKTLWNLGIDSLLNVSFSIGLTINGFAFKFNIIAVLLLIVFNRLLKKKQELA